MTEPGTSSLGKTERCPSPSLTSGLTWSAGMKSCTGRGHGAGVGTGEEAEATCVSRPGPGLTDPAGSLCFPPSATRCSWRARCGGKAWGSSSYRFCSSWPTGREGVCVSVCACVRVRSSYRFCSSWPTGREGVCACVSEFLIQILQLMANRWGVCVCAIAALGRSCLCRTPGRGVVGTRLTGVFWKKGI